MDGEGRVFLRGISSDRYGVDEHRRRQRVAPRVIRKGWTIDGKVGYGEHGDRYVATWMLAPGDEPFLTQTLQSHFVELLPGGWNKGHGHQNEALFYILEGRGYEIHDGTRYGEWEKDDVVIVHNDSVHQHFNASQTERALCLVIKAKATWIYLGLVQQGRGLADDADVGPREDWTRLWSAGVQDKKKIVKSSDTRWETTRDGRVRVITSPSRQDVRAHSVDLYQQEITAGSRSAKHWHMSDELVYVMGGSGHSLHWDVEADIDDRYYARIRQTPKRWEVRAGEMLYIPPNTVHQHFADAGAPLLLLSAQNRLFKLLGYDSVVHFEDAPDAARPAVEVGRV